MMTKTFESTAVGAPWAPSVFKATAALTFVLGFALHTTRLIIGVERVVSQVVTPPVDIAFAFLMLTAALAGALSWRRYSGGRAGRFVYGFMMLILVGSLPLHFRSWVVWNTDLLLTFPPWYSAAEVPMFLGLSYIATRLKFD